MQISLVFISSYFSNRSRSSCHLQVPPRTSSSRRSSTPTLRRCCNTLKPLRCIRGAAHPRCWGTKEDRKRGDKARGNGATSFQVSGDGGARTWLQSHNDHGVHQQPQAGHEGHWGGHLQTSQENRAPPSPDLWPAKPKCEYEYRFKRMSLAADLRIPETRSSFYDGEPMPWKMDDKPTSSIISSTANET